MELKIRVDKVEKIKEALAEVEGKASKRTFDSDDITGIIDAAEKKLGHLSIPKKYWDGTEIHCHPARVPNSYRYVPEGTFVTFKRIKSAWYVTSIERHGSSSCPNGSTESYLLILSNMAQRHIPSVYYI